MESALTDLSRSLEQLTGFAIGDPSGAPTTLVENVRRSWIKPLDSLSDDEIGRLVVQHCGYPYLLDLIWPKLEAEPLFDGGYYPGDVLSNLIRAGPETWSERPRYRARLKSLCRRALERPLAESDGFRRSLGRRRA